MFGQKVRDKALSIHRESLDKYNAAIERIRRLGEALYKERCVDAEFIAKTEDLVGSVAGQPKEISAQMHQISVCCVAFRRTEQYAREASEADMQAAAGAIIGAAGGAAVAALGPEAMLWMATTFGTGSAGAVSALSSAAAGEAALAGFAGGTGGAAFSALAGPIGWCIAGGMLIGSLFAMESRNTDIAEKAMLAAQQITFAGAQIHERGTRIDDLLGRTVRLREKAADLLRACDQYRGIPYSQLEEDSQYRLGVLVNNTLSLAQLTNETV